MDYTEKCLRCEDKYQGHIIYVHRDTVSLPDGSTSFREIVEHSGGVAVIPVDESGNVWCVRQYRYAFREHLLEVPAGKLNEGENPLDCAVRELSEETGFSAEKFTFLGELLPSPGYCKETLYLYLATGLKPGKAHLDPGEFLDVERHTLDELTDMVMNNQLTDAKTAMAVLKARQVLKERAGDKCQKQC